MSLRDTLAAAVGSQANLVARCEPQETQRATRHQGAATERATGAQLAGCASPGCRPQQIASDSVSCALRVPENATRNYGDLTAHRLLADLIAAINAACDERGDDDSNRRALIDESARLTPEHQLDMLAHFTAEAAIFRAANRGGRASGAEIGPTGAFPGQGRATVPAGQEIASDAPESGAGSRLPSAQSDSTSASPVNSPTVEQSGDSYCESCCQPAGSGSDSGSASGAAGEAGGTDRGPP